MSARINLALTMPKPFFTTTTAAITTSAAGVVGSTQK